MIKFFRHICQQLVSEKPSADRTSNYLKYAIGEIVLVVIGILIALQINSWNTIRQNKGQERRTLKLLQEEYQGNLIQLNNKIYLRNEMMRSALKLLSIIDKDTELLAYPVDSINNFISKTIIFPTFNPSMGVTNDIINLGKL